MSQHTPVDQRRPQQRHDFRPNPVKTLPSRSGPCLYSLGRAHCQADHQSQPNQSQNHNHPQNPVHIWHNLLIERIGAVKGIPLHRVACVYADPDMGGVRVGIAVDADIIVNLRLIQDSVPHVHQAIRIVDQVSPEFPEKLCDLVVLQVFQLLHIGVGENAVVGHHAHHELYIAVSFPVGRVADLVALIVPGKALHGRRHVLLQQHIVHPVVRIIGQLLFPVHCGIAAVEHGNGHNEPAVILPGHVKIRHILGNDIGKNQILQLGFRVLLHLFGNLDEGSILQNFLSLFRRRLLSAETVHPVKPCKRQQPELVQLKIFRIETVAEIVHKFGHTHNTVAVLHAVLSPFDNIVQLVHD